MKNQIFNSFQENDENLHTGIKAVRLGSVSEMMLRISKTGSILEFRGQRENPLFKASDEIVGKTVYDILPTAIAETLLQFAERALQQGNQETFDYQLLINTPGNHYEAKCIAIGDETVLILIRNITEHKNTEEQIHYLSYHDTLTNLPNRYLLKDRLEQAIATAVRKKRLLSIILIDLDNFKNINDTIGHTSGDLLLQGFADRLSKCLRHTDSISRLSAEEQDSVLARLGGDEFTILLSEIDTIHDPIKVCNRVIEMLSEPFILGTHEIFVTVSIGIAVYPFDGKDIDTLIKNADVAMYQAKSQGRNNFQYYSESLNIYSLERFTIANKLQKALDHNEFMLFYQPQIDIMTGELIGVEALIRWLQPDLILIKPGEFIPLAEEAGIIVPIGDWVLRTACSQNVAWQKAGIQPMSMTVNISSIQFRQEGFVEKISEIVRQTGLDPAYLQLELTEGTIMKHSEDTVRKLHALQETGIRISLDDFGTGYSSLNYLKRFPLSTLKIDRSFIQDIAINTDDQTITKTIIDIAHNFHLTVIAEGVETRKQLSLLRTYGCTGIQGHLICPPINPASLAEFVKRDTYRSILKGS